MKALQLPGLLPSHAKRPQTNDMAPAYKKKDLCCPSASFKIRKNKKKEIPVTIKRVVQEKALMSFSSLVFSIGVIL